MEGNSGISQRELTKEIEIDGHKLLVIATKIENEGWQLSVVNEHGIYTNWIDYFPSAKIAMDTALKTIETEDIEEFIKPEGFEYLYENHV